MSSYTIKGTNQTIRGGDTVLFNAGGNELPYVGLVKEITLGRSDPEVTVAWFYRPRDTCYANAKFIGKDELFYSKHIDNLSAETIIGKCVVHHFTDYLDLKSIGPTDFYCRYRYDYITKNLDAGRDKVAVYCICELPNNPDRAMIKCEGSCHDW
ncbi:chromatin remodeling protein EBS-like [Vicia villosa]|uniref:chromatin remodeling protein EBS-like n=1 Tax=Vicia villosa TaxID=3911 RepID=UPI00273C5F40|nr:chromatin remodeling protein EBS-like [Vicia villosa]